MPNLCSPNHTTVLVNPYTSNFFKIDSPYPFGYDVGEKPTNKTKESEIQSAENQISDLMMGEDATRKPQLLRTKPGRFLPRNAQRAFL